MKELLSFSLIKDVLVISLATTHLWVRVFGYGFSLRWNSKPLFSERYGYKKVYRYQKVAFEFLVPHPYSHTDRCCFTCKHESENGYYPMACKICLRDPRAMDMWEAQEAKDG